MSWFQLAGRRHGLGWVAEDLGHSYHLDMSRELSVHFLPSLFDPDEVRGGIAVMIDVLRASTTIIHALAAGANVVLPCEEVDEARRLAAKLTTGSQDGSRERGIILGGERDGVLIEGFDLDNSPLRYTEASVKKKTIVFTTTNGTGAMFRSRQADRILIGAFVNLAAVVEHLVVDVRPIHLVCAGTRGEITAEDVLCAGAMAEAVLSAVGGECRINDQCKVAMSFYAAHSKDTAALFDAMRTGVGGANLCANGLEADIERAASMNLFTLIPEYFLETGRIEPMTLQADGQKVREPTDG